MGGCHLELLAAAWQQEPCALAVPVKSGVVQTLLARTTRSGQSPRASGRVPQIGLVGHVAQLAALNRQVGPGHFCPGLGTRQGSNSLFLLCRRRAVPRDSGAASDFTMMWHSAPGTGLGHHAGGAGSSGVGQRRLARGEALQHLRSFCARRSESTLSTAAWTASGRAPT